MLAPTGKLQANNGTSGGRVFGTMGNVIKTAALSRFVPQQLGPSIKFSNRKDLEVLKGLIEAGKGTPVIDGNHPLSWTPEAIAQVGKGHTRGTLVITVDAGDQDGTTPATH